eukprot:scaffold2388_cov163-Amphora_coffeaeformis.AAC.10
MGPTRVEVALHIGPMCQRKGILHHARNTLGGWRHATIDTNHGTILIVLAGQRQEKPTQETVPRGEIRDTAYIRKGRVNSRCGRVGFQEFLATHDAGATTEATELIEQARRIMLIDFWSKESFVTGLQPTFGTQIDSQSLNRSVVLKKDNTDSTI